MDAGAGIGLFICLVIIVVVGTAFKINTDNKMEDIKIHITEWTIVLSNLKQCYHGQDIKLDNMCDIIKKQQEEIKILKDMIEPEENKKCCRNCRFYYELNNQSSACLNVNVNNKHKGDSTIYAENRPISFGTIKRIKPNDCCEYYEPKEESNE